MRLHCCTVGVLLSLLCPSASLADRPAVRKCANARPSIPNITAILKEASEIGIRQDEHQDFWCDRALLVIAEVQKRAGDFDGALHTITNSNYPHGRNRALSDLAKTMARAGRRKQAFIVLRQMEDHRWRQDLLDDDVTMAYMEYQISKSNLKGARQTIENFKAALSRSKGLKQLAVAQAKRGNRAAAKGLFRLALPAGTALPDDYDRDLALWEIADARIAVANFEPASAAIRRLPQHAVLFRRGSAKVAVLLREEAKRAKIRDPSVRFAKANSYMALNLIAKTQAAFGYIHDALETARLIKHSERESSPDGTREEALCAIAVAQAKSGDIRAAVTTAHSIEYYIQYETDALVEITSLQIKRGELREALATAKQIRNPSRKAVAYLKVAIAYAKAGDKNTARAVAGRIRLTPQGVLGLIDPVEFDYSKPRTWGVVYQASFTMSSLYAALERASEVAAAAMTLSQVLGQHYPKSYAIMFADFRSESVVRALARAHATSGDANEALAWARRIGSNQKISSSEDSDATISVRTRIYAMVGVAEGILDKQRRGNAE